VVVDYEESHGRKIFLGDNFSYEIVGHGNVKVQNKDGSMKWILNVWHVSELEQKLLSMNQMVDVGVDKIFS